MYIHLRLFFKAQRLAWTERPIRVRRLAFVVCFTLLFAAMWVLVAFGRLLDHVFFPGFKRQPVREPVFIVAPPRSGTTLVQKLMARDTQRFACVRLYETIFPSVTIHRVFDAVAWIDRRAGRVLTRVSQWVERRFFGGWEDLHKMRFNEPEEDDGFFVYTFVTEAIYLLFPYVNELWGAGFPDDLPEPERRAVMRYYRTCLQRHLHAVGPDKTLLSKATQHSGSILALLAEFPDARIVTIIRHPASSIASHVSVFYPVWKVINPAVRKDSRQSREYAALAAAWFRHLWKARERVDPGRYFCIRYDELAEDPMACILRVYGHFGFEPGESYLGELEAARQRQKTFKSKHQYSLEEYGLDEDWLRREVGEVIDFYGLSATEAPAGSPPTAIGLAGDNSGKGCLS